MQLYKIEAKNFLKEYAKNLIILLDKMDKNRSKFITTAKPKNQSRLKVVRIDAIYLGNGNYKVSENDLVSGGLPSLFYPLDEEEKKKLAIQVAAFYKSEYDNVIYATEPHSPYYAEGTLFEEVMNKYTDIHVEVCEISKEYLKGKNPEKTLIHQLFYPYELTKGGEEELKKFDCTSADMLAESKLVFAKLDELGLTKKELTYFRKVFPYSITLENLMEKIGSTHFIEKSIAELSEKRAVLKARIEQLEITATKVKVSKKMEKKLLNLKLEDEDIVSKKNKLKTLLHLQLEVQQKQNALLRELGINANLKDIYKNYSLINRFLEEGAVLKNTDLSTPTAWGARGVLISLDYTIKKFLKALTTFDEKFGENPIVQELVIGEDVREFSDAKYEKLSGVFNYNTPDAPKDTVNYKLNGRFGFFILINEKTKDYWVLDYGILTALHALKVHGTKQCIVGVIKIK